MKKRKAATRYFIHIIYTPYMMPIFSLLRLAAFDLLTLRHLWGLTLSVVATLIIFLGLAWGLGVLLDSQTFFTGWFAFLNPIIHWLGQGALAFLGWFIFPLVVTALAQLFLEYTAAQLVRQHYPFMPPARAVPIIVQFKLMSSSLWRAIGLNLIILPLIFTPLYPILYVVLNASLFARDYAFVVLLAYLSLQEAEQFYIAHKKSLRRIGLVISCCFIIPFVNVVAPFLAISMMVHTLCAKKGFLWQTLALNPQNVLGVEHEASVPAAARNQPIL